MDLFYKHEETAGAKPLSAPLAERLRPKSIKGFVGQEHLVADGKFISRAIEKRELPSLILWGPPGTGKTTLARIIAGAADAEFIEFSAVLSGVKDVRDAVKRARENLKKGVKTVLFVDEIHRFNKAQQDAFLHSVEDGTITLIGATTENPSFEIISPLLSRCKVLLLNPLSPLEIKELLKNSIVDVERGLGNMPARTDEATLDFIAEACHGDARCALNCLETAYFLAEPDLGGLRRITVSTAEEALQSKALLYDRAGEEHYNVISAFIKSMRASDPDAALYWLARMIEAGEDPLFIAR
ncbi:MAG: replication-associated recombination protein A, partial [Deltaproteobacteria bacterium]